MCYAYLFHLIKGSIFPLQLGSFRKRDNIKIHLRHEEFCIASISWNNFEHLQ